MVVVVVVVVEVEKTERRRKGRWCEERVVKREEVG